MRLNYGRFMKRSCRCKNARQTQDKILQRKIGVEKTQLTYYRVTRLMFPDGLSDENTSSRVNQGHCCHGRLLSSKLRESGGGRGYTHSSLVLLGPPHPLELTFACWAPHLLCSPAEGIRCLPPVGQGYCLHWRVGNNHWQATLQTLTLSPLCGITLVTDPLNTLIRHFSNTPPHPAHDCTLQDEWSVNQPNGWGNRQWSNILTSPTIGPPRPRHKSMYYKTRLSKVVYSQAKARNNLLMH